MSMPPLKESKIHKAVVEHWMKCGRPNTLVATIPNMGAMGQFGLTKGLPDLLVIGPGIHGYIELKTEVGKLTAPQRDFEALCHKHNVLFAVTHGRDEPISLLKRWGIVA
ncbi:hypothetical protein NN6n1_13050 [Shinella zoogloeoides]